MKIPDNTEVYETQTSIYWFDEDGILYSITKPDAPKLNSEEFMEQIEEFISNFGGEKKCMLIDAKYAKPNSHDERKASAEMLPKMVKALAIIVHNPLGRMVVNLFIGLEKPKYPMKIFKPGEEEKAREWLKQYLNA